MEYKGYRVPTKEELEEMRSVDIKTVDRDTLVDIDTVEVDENLPKRERMLDYIGKIKNPYCYLHKGIVVKISFAGKERLEDCLRRCIDQAL